MMQRSAFLRDSELDRSSYPEFRDRVSAFEQEAMQAEPRAYPGYPKLQLPRVRPRLLTGLEKTLLGRRCLRRLGVDLPSKRTLSRLLQFAHGVCAGEGRGPVPSSGGLQGLELYLVAFEDSWLPSGVHHYDRAGHHLCRVAGRGERRAWQERVPSMGLVEGGALLWVLVGDGARLSGKYGDRGGRFLLLEAGHLMQNLCLMSASVGLSTVPMGASWEPEIARELDLLASDAVLYVGLCG